MLNPPAAWADGGVGWLAGMAWRSALLVMFAGVACAFLRRRRAATRHLVWTLALAGASLMPLVCLLPGWEVPILPARSSAHAAHPGGPDAARAALSAEPPAVSARQSPHVAQRPPEDGGTHPDIAGAGAATAPEARSMTGGSAGADWGGWIVAVWAAGVLAVLARLYVGLIGLRRLRRRSDRVSDRSLIQIIAEAAEQLGVRRRIELRIARADAGVAVPIVWGWLRPTLLLPAAAAAWTRDRLAAAALHELGHVRRCDWLTQLLAHVTVALHWYNPLVWLAARRARADGERACDDLALTGGQRASGYGEHLLAIAATMEEDRVRAATAVPMARGHGLAGRLRAVLDSSLPRGPVRRAIFVTMTCLSAATIGSLAMLRAVQGAGPTSEVPLVAPGGSGIELRFIAWHGYPEPRRSFRILQAEGRYWAPDGKLLPDRHKLPPLESDQITLNRDPQRITLWFTHRYAGPWPKGKLSDIHVARVQLRTSDGGEIAGLRGGCVGVGSPNSHKTRFGWIEGEFEVDPQAVLPEKVDVHVRYATGPWEGCGLARRFSPRPAGTRRFEGFLTCAADWGDFGTTYAQVGRTREVKSYAVLLIHRKKHPDEQFRVLAVPFVDRDGHREIVFGADQGKPVEPNSTGRGDSSLPDTERITCEFPIPLEDVAFFTAQRRPIRTAVLRNISLEPIRRPRQRSRKRLPNEPARPLRFGPVQQQTLYDLQEPGASFIDFDTGRACTGPAGEFSFEALGDFVAKHGGVDAACRVAPGGIYPCLPSAVGMHAMGCQVTVVKAETWDTLTADQIAQDTDRLGAGMMSFTGRGSPPQTYVIHTSEGGVGIVQVTEIQNERRPRYLKLRYKMLRTRPADE